MLCRCGARRRKPGAQILRRRDDQAIRDMVSALPDPFREAIVLREINDLSYREIAEIIVREGRHGDVAAGARALDAARGVAVGGGRKDDDDLR